jgi:hypothetical protein
VVTFGRSHLPLPCDRGSILDLADLCSARLWFEDPSLFTHWGWRAIDRDEVSCFSKNDDDDDDFDGDDVDDDGDGNVADDDAGEKAMLDDVDRAVAPKMNTPLVAVSGMVGAVGGAKENAERNCASG